MYFIAIAKTLLAETLILKECFFQIVKQEENIRTKMEKETRCRSQVLSKCNNTYVFTHYIIINTFVSLHNLSNCSLLDFAHDCMEMFEALEYSVDSPF